MQGHSSEEPPRHHPLYPVLNCIEYPQGEVCRATPYASRSLKKEIQEVLLSGAFLFAILLTTTDSSGGAGVRLTQTL